MHAIPVYHSMEREGSTRISVRQALASQDRLNKKQRTWCSSWGEIWYNASFSVQDYDSTLAWDTNGVERLACSLKDPLVPVGGPSLAGLVSSVRTGLPRRRGYHLQILRHAQMHETKRNIYISPVGNLIGPLLTLGYVKLDTAMLIACDNLNLIDLIRHGTLRASKNTQRITLRHCSTWRGYITTEKYSNLNAMLQG